MDIMERILELSREGYTCSQIMLEIALEMEGKSNPDLLRAVQGLAMGIGGSRNTCGALTGGAAFLAYFAGKGEADELEHPDYDEIQAEFTDWFRAHTREYGGQTCECIIEGDMRNQVQRCPVIIRDTLEKCIEILEMRNVI